MFPDAQEQLLALLQRRVDAQDEELARFHKNFQEKPFHALTWADDTFQAVASRQVFTWVQAALTKPGTTATLYTIRNYALEQALLHLGRTPSTSACENLVNVCMGRAWTSLLGHLVEMGVPVSGGG